MNIRYERLWNSWMIGLSFHKDDGLYFGPVPDDPPTDLTLLIFLLIGYIEISVRLP